MKTIANCNPREFAAQTAKLASSVKKYADNLKSFKNESGETDLFSMVSSICGGNIDDTMEICGAMCFMTGEEFANLDCSNEENDGILALIDVINSKRCIRFFTTLLQLAKLM